MSSPEIYARLTTLLQDVFDDLDLVAKPELNASDVEEWDSLKHIRLVLSVERAFQVRFSTAEVSGLKNVGEMAGLIQAKL